MFTPGPWEVEQTWTGLVVTQVRTGKPYRVARIYDRFSDGRVETWANARLIAAAPDLLAALEEIVAATERWNASVEAVIGRQPSTAIDLANAWAAIAAVKGG